MAKDQGIRLKDVRNERGLTLAKLGELIERESGTISAIENGGPLSDRLATKIAEVLKVNRKWLLTGEGERDLKKEENNSELMAALARIESLWKAEAEYLKSLIKSQDETIKSQQATIAVLVNSKHEVTTIQPRNETVEFEMYPKSVTRTVVLDISEEGKLREVNGF